MELLIFLIWVLLGFWCYKIAERKGLNKGLAFIGGLIFGIFAVIGYLLAGESEQKKQERIKKIMNEQNKGRKEEQRSYEC